MKSRFEWWKTKRTNEKNKHIFILLVYRILSEKIKSFIILAILQPVYTERERVKRRKQEGGARGRKVTIKQNILVYTEREHERNLVRAENRVDCLQSEFLGGVRDGFCVQPINAQNLDYITTYTTSLHCDTDTQNTSM